MTEQAQGQPAPEPNPTPDPATQEEEPFFVAKTQDDFNKKAGITRDGVRQTIAKDYGFETPDDLEEFVKGYRALEEETESKSEKLEKRLEKLEPKAERSEALEQALTGYLEREREGLPDHITKLLDRMDVVEQLSYLNENRDALKEPEAPQTVGRGSAPGAGAGNGGGTPEEQHARSLASLLGQFNGT